MKIHWNSFLTNEDLNLNIKPTFTLLDISKISSISLYNIKYLYKMKFLPRLQKAHKNRGYLINEFYLILDAIETFKNEFIYFEDNKKLIGLKIKNYIGLNYNRYFNINFVGE